MDGKTVVELDKLFQSTRPARGATSGLLPFRPTRCNFNPRALRGATVRAHASILKSSDFNPRAP